MRICLISDTHQTHPDVDKFPDADLLLHCGDATKNGCAQEFIAFNKWLITLKQKFPHIIFTPGNHDLLFEDNEGFARSLVQSAEVLIGETTMFQGLRIHGFPWVPKFYNWAFMQTSTSRKVSTSEIPECDVLMTHGPPYGIGDVAKNFSNTGCPWLLQRVEKLQPKLHVYGHIHECHGQTIEIGGTKFINAAQMDRHHRPLFEPIVVEI